MWFWLHQELRTRNLMPSAHITDEEFKAQEVWMTGKTVSYLPAVSLQSYKGQNAVTIAILTCGLYLSEQLLLLQPFLKWHDFRVWPTHIRTYLLHTHTHHFYKLWNSLQWQNDHFSHLSLFPSPVLFFWTSSHLKEGKWGLRNALAQYRSLNLICWWYIN